MSSGRFKLGSSVSVTLMATMVRPLTHSDRQVRAYGYIDHFLDWIGTGVMLCKYNGKWEGAIYKHRCFQSGTVM